MGNTPACLAPNTLKYFLLQTWPDFWIRSLSSLHICATKIQVAGLVQDQLGSAARQSVASESLAFQDADTASSSDSELEGVLGAD